MTLEYEQKTVAQFQTTFDTPTEPDFWIGLVEEEMEEVVEAVAHLLKELADLDYVIAGLANTTPYEAVKDDPRIQAMLERSSVVSDVVEALGNPDSDVRRAAFIRVHASNMSKVDPATGQPIRRESDGKIMKGPNYQPPEMVSLVLGGGDE